MSPSRDPPLPAKLHHLPDPHHKLGTKCSNPGREISCSSHSVPLARPYKQAYFPVAFVIVKDFWSPLKWNHASWWLKCRVVTRTPQRHKLSSSTFTTNVLLVINYNNWMASLVTDIGKYLVMSQCLTQTSAHCTETISCPSWGRQFLNLSRICAAQLYEKKTALKKSPEESLWKPWIHV